MAANPDDPGTPLDANEGRSLLSVRVRLKSGISNGWVRVAARRASLAYR